MVDRWSYELSSHPAGGGRFLVAVHVYRHLGTASTAEEHEFDSFKEAVAYLENQLNA